MNRNLVSLGQSVTLQKLNKPGSEKILRLENGLLPLAAVKEAFPGCSTEVVYNLHGVNFILALSNGYLLPPHDGWNSRMYYVNGNDVEIANGLEATTVEVLIPPGEEPWDHLASWDSLEPSHKLKDTLASHVVPDLFPLTTSLYAHADCNPKPDENFEILYGKYQALDSNPIGTMFDRMDEAMAKRKRQQEEERNKQSSYRRKRSRSRSYDRHRSPRDRRARSRSRSRDNSRSRRRSPSPAPAVVQPTRAINPEKPGDGDGEVEVIGERNPKDEPHVVVSLSSSEDEAGGDKGDSAKEATENKKLSEEEQRKKDKEKEERRKADAERRRRREEMEKERRRRAHSAERKYRELRAEEERTRNERRFYAEERRRLREERRRVEERLRSQREQEKWLQKSNDFLAKLGIDPSAPAPSRNDDVYNDRYSNPGRTESPYDSRDSHRRRSGSREDMMDYPGDRSHRDRGRLSPDLMARYGQGSSLDSGSRLAGSRSRNLSPDGHSNLSQHSYGSGGAASRYPATSDLHEDRRGYSLGGGPGPGNEAQDFDFRRVNREPSFERGSFGDRGSDFQDDYPRKNRNESPGGGDGDEIQFGKSLPESRGAVQQDPVQLAEQQTNSDKLKPGNYLVVALDIVSLGSGLNSELYQIGAYSIHGETFIKCIEPVNFKEDAENDKELPMVMFKNSFHINNRQTGAMEPCVTEVAALRNFTDFLAKSIHRVRPRFDSVVLVCASNYMINTLTKHIKMNALEGQFWSRVAAIGSIEHLAKEHPNGRHFLEKKESSIEDIYYTLFKRMVPFAKHFSNEKAKFYYEVLVKLLDRNPSYSNYLQEYTFTRSSREMHKIRNPTFFLNKWETYAPLRLFIIRTLKIERQEMHEEDCRFLPKVDDVSKKICRNLIDAGFVFEELLDMAKARGLSGTELHLRTVLLRRMAGQDRNVIDTAVQTTKFVIGFLVQNGHKGLDEMLDDVRSSEELKREYETPPAPPPPSMTPEDSWGGGGRMPTGAAGAASSAQYPAGSSTDTYLNSMMKADSNVSFNTMYKHLPQLDREDLDCFRKYVVNRVMETFEKGWKTAQFHKCCEVLLRSGLSINKLIELNKSDDGAMEAELLAKVKPIFNQQGPVHIGFKTYTTWMKDFLDRESVSLEKKRIAYVARMEARGLMKGIPRSTIRQRKK